MSTPRPIDGTLRVPLPVDEAVRVAIRIADVLAAIHRDGHVFRELRPGTVIVGGDGHIRLAADAPGESLDNYRSPEQLEGRDADARSDIFAFGAVLYEMITGRRAFDARNRAGVIAAVVHEQPPPIMAFGKDVPRELERLIQRALEKSPERRWQTTEAVKDALEWVAEGLSHGPSRPAAGPPPRAGAQLSRWLLAGVAVGGIAVAAVLWASRGASAPERLQVEVALPEELTFGFDSLIAIAPNGRSFLVNASKTLWLRSLEDGSLRALPGTTGALLPFWSPDGEWVAFFADGKLKKMRLPDGPAVVLAEAPNPRGGTWGARGTIVYAPQALGPLARISAEGGTPEPATVLDPARQEDQHTGPTFLPDGSQFLYHARSTLKDNSSLALGSTSGPPSHTTRGLVTADTAGWYAPPARRGDGYLLFLRRRNLLAQRFDPRSGHVSGEPTVLGRRVRVMADNVANMSVAARGQLVYVADEPRVNQPRWYSREGSLISSVGDLGEYVAARMSPKGTHLSTVRADPVDFERSVWVLDVARNLDTQITLNGNLDDPVWSPDSSRLAFAWSPPGEETANLYEMSASEPGTPRPLVPAGAIRWPLDWSPDGRRILYAQIDPMTNFDLWDVAVDGSSPPRPLVVGRGKDNEARYSPDGRFIAYQSDEIRETRVYVMAYPPAGRPTQISDGSGSEPRWRADGKELYYIAGDGGLVAVPIDTTGADIRAGRPARLFGGRDSRLRVWHYQPAPDGQRFLVLNLSDDSDAAPVHLITGWQ